MVDPSLLVLACLLALSAPTLLICRALREYDRRRTTVLADLSSLGRTRASGLIAGTVVIAGGSIAGIAAARVCSDHFDDVIIIEPDDCLTPNMRDGVPQYDHMHIFPNMTLQIMRRLFPNFDQQALDVDARILAADPGISAQGASAVPTLLPEMLFVSRARFEALFRRLMFLSCPNVRQVRGTVVGATLRSGAIDNITYVPHPSSYPQNPTSAGDANCEKTSAQSPVAIRATLFIDASGSSSLSAALFPESASTLPPVETYDPCVSIVTGYARLPDAQSTPPNIGFVRSVVHEEGRVGHVMRVERDRFCLSLAARAPSQPLPTSLDSFVSAFSSASPPEPWTHALCPEKVERPWNPLKVDSCIWVKNHKGERPGNYISVGDAAMRLNPLFGTGVSKALMDATTLHAVLEALPMSCVERSPQDGWDSLPAGFSKTFFKRQAPRLQKLWVSNKALDYAHPTTAVSQEDTRKTGSYFRWYHTSLMSLAKSDAFVARTVAEVSQLSAPESDLYAAPLFLKVLGAAIMKRARGWQKK
ncbi:hypothetical protein BOTBODRAFT_33414 [Botryobasidium botryosum FD-172 SS1]|uniref:FAD-binding domain-containing protein n=1 Tax=Botryobasidium botryosum (strain FD-172 SS1) TaxID=930990 RepID=A0A067MPA6_BOTB1|nr:hypothetical protein BOTBODRAFT_33414 [Botryobasidium botryosum FD-172 SS1]